MVLRRLFLLGAGLAGIFLLTGSFQITLTVNGPTWPPNPINVTYLSSGAGSDFGTLVASAANYASIAIAGGGGSWWEVDVVRVDTNWPTGPTLYVQRTSNGGGTGSITGGDLNVYKEITTTSQELFRGTGHVDTINLQYKLEELHVTVGVNSYSTAVQYTVVTH